MRKYMQYTQETGYNKANKRWMTFKITADRSICKVHKLLNKRNLKGNKILSITKYRSYHK